MEPRQYLDTRQFAPLCYRDLVSHGSVAVSLHSNKAQKLKQLNGIQPFRFTPACFLLWHVKRSPIKKLHPAQTNLLPAS